MDLRERTGQGEGVANRHPWELSRTARVLKVFSKYLDQTHGKEAGQKYVNVGAGDLYFDKKLLNRYQEDTVYAVDLEYDETVPDYPRTKKHHYLEEITEEMDYAIMMDSLEYMPDDADYLKKLSGKVKEGGYLFFTLPAIQGIFSEYDHIVANLRRYDRKDFCSMIAGIPEMEMVECHYFYTSLFLIRLIQVKLKLAIDKERKVTSHWKYTQRNIVTGLLVLCLNIDFCVNRALHKIGIHLPGLSLLAVCKKVSPSTEQ